jgi:glycosyltransferase involved in cell wall biosynthesis
MPRSRSATPLVSIVMFCRNDAATIGRAVGSVLGNGYANLELVVQDGASTDGTLDILRSYGERIRLVSEPDNGASDAFQRAMRRCRGELIGSCQSDEELLPGAIGRAVETLTGDSGLGAVIGDTLLTDGKETTTGRAVGAQFDLVEYLFGNGTPYFCACFFSRAALDEIGAFGIGIDRECMEFEIWTRLGTRFDTAYIPVEFAKYAVREAQLSNTAEPMLRHVNARAEAVTRFFSDDGFFGADPKLRDYCLFCQYRQFYAHAVTYGIEEIRWELERRIEALPEGVAAKDFAATWLSQQRARQYWLSLGNLLPPRLKRRILELGLHRRVRPLFMHLAQLKIPRSGRAEPSVQSGLSRDDAARLMICHEMARRFEARGQTAMALRCWRRAEQLGDATIDSCAVQAMQKAPQLRARDLLDGQRRWADHHAGFPQMAMPAQSDSARPLRVGYHCAWWDSPVARHQLLNFIKYHDRSVVNPVCYSPLSLPGDIARHFGLVRITRGLSDEAFATLVRADGIDVFIETTGFSPDHRYGAMARRCAPVQISYLNHHATTGVPNVDYVLGDEVAAGGTDGDCFTETIYKLPGCFFCFDLRGQEISFSAMPPSCTRGYVTFGCFGSGGKINLELIQMWAEILNRVPSSRLMLRNGTLTPADNRRFALARFARYGIGENRLALLGGVDHHTILANYSEIDISLDTWPYCGGNTIAESVWQGVPVISLLGDRFSSRYGASLLEAQGCGDLVANSKERYVEIAVQLAGNPKKLMQYRKDFRAMASKFGFNDSEAFARKVEGAFACMLRKNRGCTNTLRP